jgi:hypothetical protein
MSPARSKRQPVPHRRSRADVVRAVAVGAGIVLATSILIWLLRPGPAGIPGTGGLMNRQPRSSWLVGTAIGVAALGIWWILRGSRRAKGHEKLLIPITVGVVLLVAVIAGILWPGGLLRHDVAPAPEPTTTTTTTKPGSSTTAPAGSSTSTPSSTSPSGSSTVPATAPTTVPSTVATTVPTTGSP